jgi:hypothetical protein
MYNATATNRRDLKLVSRRTVPLPKPGAGGQEFKLVAAIYQTAVFTKRSKEQTADVQLEGEVV